MILRILLFLILCTLSVKAYSPLSIYEANGDLLIKDPIGLTFNGFTLSQTNGEASIVNAAGGTVTSVDNGDVFTEVANETSTPVITFNNGLVLGNGDITINNGNTLVTITNGTLQDSDIVIITPEANLSNYTNDAGFLENGNNLSDLDNTSTARTNLGLVIGTDVQAYSANLDTLALNNGAGLIGVDALTLNGILSSNVVLLDGNNTLTGNNTFSSSNTTDAVSINQSSSTGIALNITKGGNNEALYINKSSGSGNAVTITGGALSTDDVINMSAQTASTITSFDGSKNLVSLSTATYPSLTELSYVKGVTSAIQTQLNAKLENTTDTFIGTLTANGAIVFDSASLGNSGTAITVDFTDSNKQEIDLNDNCTITLTGPEGTISSFLLIINQTNGGSHAATWAGTNGNVLWPGGTAPTITTTNGAIDEVTFTRNLNGDFLGGSIQDFQ